MKRTIAPTILVIALATLFVLGNLPGARAGEHGQAGDRRECSDASLQGSFGFTSMGTLLALPAPLAGPFGEVGRHSGCRPGLPFIVAGLYSRPCLLHGTSALARAQVCSVLQWQITANNMLLFSAAACQFNVSAIGSGAPL